MDIYCNSFHFLKAMPPEKLFANLNYEEHKAILKDFVNKLISDKKLNINNPTQEIAMDDLIIYNE